MCSLLCSFAGELLKELNSSDVAIQKKAVEKADCLVASLQDKPSKSVINRTVINSNPSCVERPVIHNTVFICNLLLCKHFVIVSFVYKGESKMISAL